MVTTISGSAAPVELNNTIRSLQKAVKSVETSLSAPLSEGNAGSGNRPVDRVSITPDLTESLAQLQELDRELSDFGEVLRNRLSDPSALQSSSVNVANNSPASALVVSGEITNDEGLQAALTQTRETLQSSNLTIGTSELSQLI